ncbi:MAG: hypothetical protein PHW01_04490 [Patescibacteria group bacterium]|nr:hypothetical protein [Patescibacteria group bacterium]
MSKNKISQKYIEKMRFACIEYSTKTGRIWQPTPEKPNYLCDPETEIDPTSFGCWTSAFSGEHIPVNFLRRRQNPHTLSYKLGRKLDLTMEKIQRKPIYRNLDYLKKFNLILFLVHSFSMPLMADLIRKTKKVNPNAIYLGSIVSPLGILREVWKKENEFRAFKTFANNCNIFINVNHDAQDYLQSFLPAKVVYFPQFYPFEYAHRFFKKREEKEKVILVAGETGRTDNFAGQFAAVQIQKKYPEFLIQVVDYPRSNIAPLETAHARFEIIPFLKWQENLKRLACFFLVINMDQTWTLGRLQADCAAVGTPSIGINANNQLEFFPKLSIPDIAGIKQGIELAEKLISDPAFYQNIQQHASAKLSENNYAKSKEKLLKIL